MCRMFTVQTNNCVYMNRKNARINSVQDTSSLPTATCRPVIEKFALCKLCFDQQNRFLSHIVHLPSVTCNMM